MNIPDIATLIQGQSTQFMALPLAFALGLLSALTSACCTIPAMGMLVAYSGTRKETERRAAMTTAAWFLIGTVFALVVMGLVASLIGQSVQVLLGRYWELFAGLVAVVIGIGALKLLPLPAFSKSSASRDKASSHLLEGAFGGLAIGGGVAASSLPCNPAIFIVMGANVLMGKIVWGISLMALYALGFGLPLAAILLGISLGKASVVSGKVEPYVRTVAGIAIMLAGLYLLATF